MADRKNVAVLFDGSLEGFLCVVYAYYYDGITPLNIQEERRYQRMLDTEEYYISTNYEHAAKVQQAVRKKISHAAESNLSFAFLADVAEKAEKAGENKYMDIFRYLLLGFKIGAKVDNHLQQDYVLCVQKLARATVREAHLLMGFCRFAQTKGVYYCEISPVHNVLSVLAEHFSDRMMNQVWIIHDKKRKLAAVYNGNEYVITEAPAIQMEQAQGEAQIQEMWLTFFNTVSIKERANPKLQRNLLPLRYRGSMPEFNHPF